MYKYQNNMKDTKLIPNQMVAKKNVRFKIGKKWIEVRENSKATGRFRRFSFTFFNRLFLQ